MNTKKGVTLTLYGAMIVAAFAMDQGTAIMIGQLFIAIAVIHFIEFLFNVKRLQASEGSIAVHFLQTMIFGLIHWMPIKRSQETTENI